jgi:GNAT superfamily N-acetyltransferase
MTNPAGPDGSSVSVRFVEASDHDAWKPMWDDYNAFYGRVGPTALAEDISLVTWQRLLDPNESVHGLVAVRNGALVGLAHYLYHRTTSRSEPVCYLNDLFTRNEFRGEGIGRALIHAVYEHARRDGARRVYWQTHETNAVAMRLYDAVARRSGFVVYGADV